MSKISFYKNAFELKEVNQYAIDEILFDIAHGKWQDYYFKVSSEEDKAKRSDIKKGVPCFTGSGIFSDGRKDENIKQHSGLIFLDIDNVEDIKEIKSQLGADQYTFALFTSISGRGLCWVVKIEAKKHADSFDGLFEYVYNKYQLRLDPSGRNISRLRFVSYDPDLIHNPDSIKFKEYVHKPRINKKETIHLHVNSQFEKLVYRVTSDICGSYTGWFEVGCAIASKYGESGLKYFEHISQYRNSSKNNFLNHEVEKQYTHCCKHSYNYKINTFYHYMKLASYDIIDRELDLVAKTAYFAKDRGSNNVEAILTIVKTVIPTDIKLLDTEQREIIEAVLNDPTFKPEGVAKLKDTDTIGDIISYLKINYNLIRNDVTKFIENDGVVIEDNDMNSIYLDIKRKFDKAKYEDILRIINSNETKTVNPLIEYCKSLNWDGHDHIYKLTKSIKTDTGADNIEWRTRMVKRWFIGIIENIHGGNCPLMFILVGKQLTGKTSFFDQLLPDKLKKYYGESQMNTGGVDDKLLMTQKLIIYDDEYSGKTKADSKLMKTLLSSKTFSMRAPYGRKNMDYKRLAVLCGTSNEDEVLNDSTGNRRLIVFKLNEMIDWDIYNTINKEQLFANATYCYYKGETSKISIEDKELMDKYTFNAHYETSIESEIIEKYFKPGDKKSGECLTNTEIYLHIKNQTKDHVIYQKKIGQELRRAGFQREFINGRYRYWVNRVTEDVRQEFKPDVTHSPQRNGQDDYLPF
jgi:predicted P-loop ATPase